MINDLKEQERKTFVTLAIGSRSVEVREKAIDALSCYGTPAIPDILNIVNRSVTRQVRTHGLAKIEEIKRAGQRQCGYQRLYSASCSR